MHLYLIRHGETQLNAAKRLRSWAESPLTEHGLRQAEDIGKCLLDVPVRRIYTSDLQSAMETADAIGGMLYKIPWPLHNLRTLDFGELNGKPMEDVKKEMDRWVHIWMEDPRKKIPGGDSFENFQDRMLSAFKYILSPMGDNDSIVVVTHGRNCSFLRRYCERDSEPLHGADVDCLVRLTQDTGTAAKYHFDPRTKRLTYLRTLGAEDYVTTAGRNT